MRSGTKRFKCRSVPAQVPLKGTALGPRRPKSPNSCASNILMFILYLLLCALTIFKITFVSRKKGSFRWWIWMASVLLFCYYCIISYSFVQLQKFITDQNTTNRSFLSVSVHEGCLRLKQRIETLTVAHRGRRISEYLYIKTFTHVCAVYTIN